VDVHNRGGGVGGLADVDMGVKDLIFCGHHKWMDRNPLALALPSWVI